LAFPVGGFPFFFAHVKAQKQTQLPVQTDLKNYTGRRRCGRPSTSTTMTATPHFFCFGPLGSTPRGCTFWPFPCTQQNSLFGFLLAHMKAQKHQTQLLVQTDYYNSLLGGDGVAAQAPRRPPPLDYFALALFIL